MCKSSQRINEPHALAQLLEAAAILRQYGKYGTATRYHTVHQQDSRIEISTILCLISQGIKVIQQAETIELIRQKFCRNDQTVGTRMIHCLIGGSKLDCNVSQTFLILGFQESEYLIGNRVRQISFR